MTRSARIVLPDVPYHVTQRGNNRLDVFFVNDDRHMYLRLLRQHAERHELEILAYCLMTNHFHLVVIPHRQDSLAKALGRTDYLYALYVNRLHGREGHLWKDRFYSCALDEKHLVAAVRYVEQNPVRAQLARRAWEYPWSSAKAHVTGKDPSGILSMKAWLSDWPPNEWRAMLSQPLAEELMALLRGCTHRGHPLGSDTFISKLESAIGFRVRPAPVGRPKGSKKPRQRKNS